MIGRVTQQMTASNLLANINQSLDRLDTTQLRAVDRQEDQPASPTTRTGPA